MRCLLRSFPLAEDSAAPADVTFSVVVSPPSRNRTVKPFHFVYRDNSRIGRTTNTWYLFRLLEWQTNLFLGENVDKFLLLHAGAVTRNGMGIILPAPSESGKTSLTTALTVGGYEYMSDAFATIEASTGLLHAYTKPLSIKNVSVFPALAQRDEIWTGPESEPGPGEIPVWYTYPDDFGGSAACGPAPVGYILFPRYDPSENPRLEPLTSGAAMRRLIENSVNFQQFGVTGLRILARLAESAQCFSLTINGLEDTVKLVDELTQETSSG
jgi:hypothetical protein